jgi:hypothetical protein
MRYSSQLLQGVILKEYKSGSSPQRISDLFGIALTHVYKYLRLAGIKFSPPKNDKKTGHFLKRWQKRG